MFIYFVCIVVKVLVIVSKIVVSGVRFNQEMDKVNLVLTCLYLVSVAVRSQSEDVCDLVVNRECAWAESQKDLSDPYWLLKLILKIFGPPRFIKFVGRYDSFSMECLYMKTGRYYIYWGFYAFMDAFIGMSIWAIILTCILKIKKNKKIYYLFWLCVFVWSLVSMLMGVLMCPSFSVQDDGCTDGQFTVRISWFQGQDGWLVYVFNKGCSWDSSQKHDWTLGYPFGEALKPGPNKNDVNKRDNKEAESFRHSKNPGASNKGVKSGPPEVKVQKLCYDFQRGGCQRVGCKFKHEKAIIEDKEFDKAMEEALKQDMANKDREQAVIYRFYRSFSMFWDRCLVIVIFVWVCFILWVKYHWGLYFTGRFDWARSVLLILIVLFLILGDGYTVDLDYIIALEPLYSVPHSNLSYNYISRLGYTHRENVFIAKDPLNYMRLNFLGMQSYKGALQTILFGVRNYTKYYPDDVLKNTAIFFLNARERDSCDAEMTQNGRVIEKI